MEDSSLVDKINPNTSHYIVKNAKVSDFITSNKHWGIKDLTNILPNHIINKIKAIRIPISDIKDIIKRDYNHGEFSLNLQPGRTIIKSLSIRRLLFYKVFGN